MKIDHKESYEDFGNQFTKDNKVDGYWGSVDLLKDIVSPFDLDQIHNKNYGLEQVADVSLKT